MDSAAGSLADVQPLAVVADHVGPVGVDGIGPRSAVYEVLGRGHVSRLDGVAARTPVEAVRGGVAAVADEVVRPLATVDQVGAQVVGDLVCAHEPADLFRVFVVPLIYSPESVPTMRGKAARTGLDERNTTTNIATGRTPVVRFMSFSFRLRRPKMCGGTKRASDRHNTPEEGTAYPPNE
jgi:hypothetical protein